MGSIRKSVTVAVLGAATFAGVLLPAAAQAAPAPNVVSKAGKSDLADAGLVIAKQINEIVGEAHARKENRSGYVKSLMEGAWYAGGQKYNVVVIRWRNNYEAHFNGVAYDQKVSADGFPAFRVAVFQDGTLVNRGDGGYDNWAFRGWFTRDGGSVTFHNH